MLDTSSDRPGRPMNRNPTWPAEKGGHQQCRAVRQINRKLVGHETFLFICFPGPLLLVSALFRWPCSISIHLSPRCVIAGVRPFPQAMQHFYSFVSQVCHCCVRPFPSAMHQPPRSVTVGVRPFPLAMQHFYSFVCQVCHCWCPPFSAGHAAFYSFVSRVCHWCCRPFPLAM